MPRRDPFAAFSTTVPMFEPAIRTDGTEVYRVSAARLQPVVAPSPDEPERDFVRAKPKGTFRVFVVGGSSAAGVPYGTGYAFSSWIARRLEAEVPAARVEVVNAATSGYASRRVLSVVREIAKYDPDLLIVYTGHNEYAEQRFYAHLLGLDPRLFTLYEHIVATRLYTLLSRTPLFAASQTPHIDFDGARDSAQMFAVIKERAEGKAYPTPRERAYGELLYRFNVGEMIRTVRRVGAQTFVLTLSQNFSGWAPGASAHRPGLSAEDLAAWERAAAEGDRLAGHDCERAVVAYRRALAIDDEYADLVYRLATCERSLGRLDAARAGYRRASDLDRVPHGAPTRFNDVLRDVAEQEGAVLVDVDAVFTSASPRDLVGDDLFVDFVHPTLRGQQLIAAAVAEALRAQGLPLPASTWAPGSFSEPTPDELYAAEPKLRVREHLIRSFACYLAARQGCALAEAEAAVAMAPGDPIARQVQEGLAHAAP